MVDGVIADHTGDMIYPYADRPGTNNERPVDYNALRQQVLLADARGFNGLMTRAMPQFAAVLIFLPNAVSVTRRAWLDIL